jgi:hypothetical protein
MLDLKKEILKEHSRAQTTKIVAYIGSDKKKFEALVDIYLAGPYRVTQRAAWPLSDCVLHHPELVKPHLSTLIKFLKRPGIHDSVKRNTTRLLQFIDIPTRLQGQVVDVCFEYLQNKKEPIAVRCSAMTVLANLSQENRDLKHELRLIIEDNLPLTTPAFTSRALKVLKAIKE